MKFLDAQGKVVNYANVMSNISVRAGRPISAEDLQGMLECEAKVYYFNIDAKTSEDISTSEDNAVLKIVETPIVDCNSKYPICISYRKSGIGSWDGCYVGTRYYLYNKQLAQYAAPAGVSALKKSVVDSLDTTFLSQVYTILYYKEDWRHNNNLIRLGTYISTLRKKLDADMSKGKTVNILLNNTGTKFIFNSKLLDCYGNYIHIMADKSSTKHSYVSSRQFVYENGFDAGVLNVPPVDFFTNIHDVVFKAEFEDIDLSDVASLKHIINERRFRFPTEIQAKSDMEIMNCLRVSIDHSVKMSKIDYKFVVPMYNIEFDKIQFLMPVYFDFGTSHKADVALVLNKVAGIWQIKTILPLENAFCNARLISNLSTSWLNSQD